jgi:hypothetical protein
MLTRTRAILAYGKSIFFFTEAKISSVEELKASIYEQEELGRTLDDEERFESTLIRNEARINTVIVEKVAKERTDLVKVYQQNKKKNYRYIFGAKNQVRNSGKEKCDAEEESP